MISQTISHYKILEKLGEGGMGVVYKAEDTKLDRIVALKFLPATAGSSPEDVARFEREARAISALNHPNIATIYDIDEDDGRKFIALEYIPGGTLKSKLKRLKFDDKEFTIAEVINYGIQIAEGLGHAHKHQIVHRDIKSDNVMLTEEDKLKITDFGLAKLRGTTHLTRTGSTMGTLAYMAPEQLRGEEIDQRTDLFSFGVVLYEMATSRLPFRGEHEAALTYSIANEDPAPVKSLRQNLPPALEQVITKCLQKDRALRYQSADEIVADLRRLQQETTGMVKTVVVKQQSKLPWMIAATSIVLGAIGVYLFMPASHPTGPNGKTIAVLPFTNMSGNPEDEYFSDGMMEDILTQLAKVGDLKVISRTSVMQFKGTTKTIHDIGNQLNAGVILEGSVRRAADQVRISAQLIDVVTDEHLWADTYDREYKQVFAIQSEIAQKIAASLQSKLSPIEKERLEKKSTDNLEAYDLYLKGRYYWNKRLPDKLKLGIEYFKQAIAKDSNYALAYAGLADSYTILGNYNLLPPQQTYPEAKAAALKALAIDSSLAEAHAALGFAILNYDWDWTSAERALKQAIKINPNYATARGWYAFLLTVTGRFQEAADVRQKAIDVDPLSPVLNADMGLTLYFARMYDEAIAQYKKTLEIDPTFVLVNVPLAGAYVQKKMYKEAIAALQTLTAGLSLASIRHPIPIAALGNVFAVSGRTDDALNMLELVEEMSASQYVAPYWMGVLSIGLGKKDEALAWLEKGYKEHDGSMVFLKVDPVFDGLHSEPKFKALLKKMNLEQ